MTSPNITNIPLEIKLQIWKYALPDHVPEVCILWPLMLMWEEEERGPWLPLLVDTAFPVLMHVCREMRHFVLSQESQVDFRESSSAGCAVPYRRYRPELDTLYLGKYNHGWLTWAIHNGIVDASLLSEARNVAIELSVPFMSGGHNDLPNFVFEYTKSMRGLSIVVCEVSEEAVEVSGSFQAPFRRCKLENLTLEVEQKVKIMDYYMDQVDFVGIWARVKEEMVDSDSEQYGQVGGALVRKGAGDGPDEIIELHGAVFSEYSAGGWVQICGQRQLGHDEFPPYIEPGERGDPKQFRPNELDGDEERAGNFYK